MIDAKGKGPYAQMASPMMTLPSPALSSGFCVCVCVCVCGGGGGRSSLLCVGSRVRRL